MSDMKFDDLAYQAKILRDKHSLHVNVQHNMFFCWQVQVQDISGPEEYSRAIDHKWLARDYGTYEQAIEAGIAHAIAQLPSQP